MDLGVCPGSIQTIVLKGSCKSSSRLNHAIVIIEEGLATVCSV